MMVPLTHVNVDGQDGHEPGCIPVERWDGLSFEVRLKGNAINAELSEDGRSEADLGPGRLSLFPECRQHSPPRAKRIVARRAGTLRQMF